MALSITSRGTGTHNTGATSFTLSPASNCTAGAMVALCVAADNSAPAGSSNNFGDVTDSLGNTWTLQQSPVFDNGAASAGVQGAIYTCAQEVGTIQSSTVITVNFGASTVAKTWTLTEIAGSVGAPSYRTGGTKAAGATSTTAAGNATTGASASVNVGEVLLAAVFVEAGTTITLTGDGDTTNGSWSTAQTTKIGTTTSGSAIISQAKVQTTAASTQSYDVTTSIASDYHAAYVIVNEITTYTPLTASSGSVVITGTAATPKAARVIGASAGATAISGSAADLAARYVVSASAGSYAIAGTNATLTYNQSTGYTLTASAGSVAISGTVASLTRSRLVTASAGAMTIGGTSASLGASRRLTSSSGSLSLTGTSATLSRVIVATASGGSVAITGTTTSFQRSLAVVGAGGSISISGTSAALRFNRAIQAASSTLAVTGTAATLTYAPAGQNTITCSPGAFTLSETAASLLAARTLSADAGIAAITGSDAAFSAAVTPRPEPHPHRHTRSFSSYRRVGSFGGPRRIRR